MPRERSKTHPAASQPRSDRVKLEHDETFYRAGHKLQDPSVCSRCEATYHEGRWTWGSAPADAHRVTCPACERIEKEYPAGLVTIRGEFARSHRDEIVRLVGHVEQHEKAEHPLKRILKIEDRGEELLVSTTDPHLARGIGDALYHAYKGELDYHYPDDEGDLLSVSWTR
jgi:NMD protein affecting ribosome stability and mRNA decay